MEKVRKLFPDRTAELKGVTRSLQRVDDRTVRVVGPDRTVNLQMASQRDSVPYYRTFRRTLDLRTLDAWPLGVRRRFLFEFKDKLIPYAIYPTRANRSKLTSAIDVVIAKAIKRERD